MKRGSRKKKRSRIQTIKPPSGVSAKALASALRKDKFFARIDANGHVVTNAPLK